jgi:predicted nucleic acid-binding protein
MKNEHYNSIKTNIDLYRPECKIEKIEEGIGKKEQKKFTGSEGVMIMICQILFINIGL